MKTAAEIFKANWFSDEMMLNAFKADEPTINDCIIDAINEARKEAIEECAKRVKIIRYQPNHFIDQQSALSEVQQDKVDKQSILSLINELK